MLNVESSSHNINQQGQFRNYWCCFPLCLINRIQLYSQEAKINSSLIGTLTMIMPYNIIFALCSDTETENKATGIHKHIEIYSWHHFQSFNFIFKLPKLRRNNYKPYPNIRWATRIRQCQKVLPKSNLQEPISNFY